MKTVPLIAAVIAAAVTFPACSSSPLAGIRVGHTPARSIAMDSSIPGKGISGQCLPYALALHKKLAAQGISSKVIVYRYENHSGTPRFTQDRAHVVVAFQDAGRTYLMDNQLEQPMWVEAQMASLEAIGELEGPDRHIISAWSLTPPMISRNVHSFHRAAR